LKKINKPREPDPGEIELIMAWEVLWKMYLRQVYLIQQEEGKNEG